MAMIAITTSNSIKVKPGRAGWADRKSDLEFFMVQKRLSGRQERNEREGTAKKFNISRRPTSGGSPPALPGPRELSRDMGVGIVTGLSQQLGTEKPRLADRMTMRGDQVL